MAVTPLHRASSVMRLGSRKRTGTVLNRRSRCSTRVIEMLGGNGRPSDRSSGQLRRDAVRARSTYRSARTVSPAMARWPTATRRLALGQIDIHPAAEADEAEALAAGRRSPSFTKRTMRRAIRPAICTTPISCRPGHLDGERLALVVVARLVELGVEELARHVGDAGQCGRRPASGSHGHRRHS